MLTEFFGSWPAYLIITIHRSRREPATEGLRFGLLMGPFIASSAVLAEAAASPLHWSTAGWGATADTPTATRRLAA